MHPNPIFRKTEIARAIDAARARGFGTLAVNADPAPLLAHVPFLIAENGQSADLHLVRSNPIARLGETEAVISVMGPDAYISPDWYGVPDQVPTWNYIAVHLRGRLHPLPQSDMHDMLDRQSAAYEDQLAPKLPWKTAKMTPDVLDRMMRQILPFRLHIEDVQSTFKLGQNKPDAVRLAAAEQVAASGIGSETVLLSDMMKSPED